MKKWEYMIQRLPCDQANVEKNMNELGQQGWEMTGCGRVGSNFDTSEILLMFFKREIPEPVLSAEQKLENAAQRAKDRCG